MKNSKKGKILVALLAIISALLVNSTSCLSQKSHFYVAISPLLPISLKAEAGIGFLSGNIGYNHDLTSRITWCLNLAYNKFGEKTIDLDGYAIKSNLAFIPFTTGIKCFFKEEGNRGYWLINGGYYFPSGDLKEGSKGLSSGFGCQFRSGKSKSRFDISLVYNAVLGGKTKDYTVIYNGGSEFTSTTYTYALASYLAINIGIVIGE